MSYEAFFAVATLGLLAMIGLGKAVKPWQELSSKTVQPNDEILKLGFSFAGYLLASIALSLLAILCTMLFSHLPS